MARRHEDVCRNDATLMMMMKKKKSVLNVLSGSGSPVLTGKSLLLAMIESIGVGVSSSSSSVLSSSSLSADMERTDEIRRWVLLETDGDDDP